MESVIELNERLEVASPPEQVWAILSDPRTVVTCVPGAELGDQKDDGKLVEELYLTFYSRLPTADEKDVGVKHLRKYPGGRRLAAEDLAWAMLNSTEFLFNH